MFTPKLRSKRITLPTLAAVAALGVESSDDRGEACEVEIRKDDGTEGDVSLDENLKVVGQDSDDVNDLNDVNDGTDDSNDAPDADDRVLSPSEQASAEKAALAAVDN